MAIPPLETFLRPALEAVAEHPNVHWQSLIQPVARMLDLKESDFAEVTPKTRQSKVASRLHWALTYLLRAKLIEKPRRGYNQITEWGLSLLEQRPVEISRNDLMQFEEFGDFVSRTKGERVEPSTNFESPTERMETAFAEVSEVLATEVAERLKNVSAAKFERIVVELMIKLGYGGSFADAGEVVGRSGDGGIDGLIRQDRLGLEMVYLQAKRWTNTVGAPEIQNFIGALSQKGSTKGVLVTISDFSAPAKQAASRNPSYKISLIDGRELAKLLIEHDLGVSIEQQYTIKRIDSDFFEEEI